MEEGGREEVMEGGKDTGGREREGGREGGREGEDRSKVMFYCIQHTTHNFLIVHKITSLHSWLLS